MLVNNGVKHEYFIDFYTLWGIHVILALWDINNKMVVITGTLKHQSRNT